MDCFIDEFHEQASGSTINELDLRAQIEVSQNNISEDCLKGNVAFLSDIFKLGHFFKNIFAYLIEIVNIFINIIT